MSDEYENDFSYDSILEYNETGIFSPSTSAIAVVATINQRRRAP